MALTERYSRASLRGTFTVLPFCLTCATDRSEQPHRNYEDQYANLEQAQEEEKHQLLSSIQIQYYTFASVISV